MPQELLDPTGNEDWARCAGKINRMLAEKFPAAERLDPTGNEDWARSAAKLNLTLFGAVSGPAAGLRRLDLSGNEDWAEAADKLNTTFAAVYAVAPWTPAVLGPKIAVWLDAEDASSLLLSGNLVTTWTSKIAPGQVSVTNSSFKPTLNPTGLNGRPTVVFDGTDDYLTSTSAFPLAEALGQAREVWALADQQAPDADLVQRDVMRYGGLTTNRMIVGRSSAGINRLRASAANGTADVASTNTAGVLSGVHILRAVTDGAQISAQMDGGVVSSSPVATALGGGVFNVGARASTANFWLGSINSLLVTAPLNNDEVASLLTYLKTRGGIA